LPAGSGNGIGHINKVNVRRARLVLGLVTFSSCAVLVFIQATQPGHSSVGRHGLLAMVLATAGEETASSAYECSSVCPALPLSVNWAGLHGILCSGL